MDKGINLKPFRALKKLIPTEEEAIKYWMKERWSKGVICVYCGYKRIASTKGKQPLLCKRYSCAKLFSCKTHSFMHYSKTGVREWLLVREIIKTAPGKVSPVFTAYHMDIEYSTARNLTEKLNKVLDK